jgi:hypothetical protein
METFPDLGALSDEKLKALNDEFTAEECEVSYQRRLPRGKTDILRSARVKRLRAKHEQGGPIITGADVRQLTDVLGGRSAPDRPEEE